MSLDAIRQPVTDDLALLNDVIDNRLTTDVPLVEKLSSYIVEAGGKRLRPTLTLLSARAAGYTNGETHAELAAVIEFLHTATLLHDDVVDESDLRRGRETANAVFGNAASVLVGDFLYSRAFQMMVKVGDIRVMNILADATNVIAEGEVMQLANVHDVNVTEAHYFRVIDCKTGKLFEAAAAVGALAANAEQPVIDALTAYGTHLGRAYQLVDDMLDYSADAEQMGKNLGDDLAEGKPTLPLLHVLATGSSEQQVLVRRVIRDGGLQEMDAVLAAIHATSALDYVAEKARTEADKAMAELNVLPTSLFREALLALARFTVARTF